MHFRICYPELRVRVSRSHQNAPTKSSWILGKICNTEKEPPPSENWCFVNCIYCSESCLLDAHGRPTVMHSGTTYQFGENFEKLDVVTPFQDAFVPMLHYVVPSGN